MRRYISRKFVRTPLARKIPVKNWEFNIQDVAIEPCDIEEDPFGYRAVFQLDPTVWKELDKSEYKIGVSLLPQREAQLQKAGYKAPMTRKAIEMTENMLGRSITSFSYQSLIEA